MIPGNILGSLSDNSRVVVIGHVLTPIESGNPKGCPALLVSEDGARPYQCTAPDGVCINSPDHLAMTPHHLPPDLQ
jgi:hypothetical protein